MGPKSSITRAALIALQDDLHIIHREYTAYLCQLEFTDTTIGLHQWRLRNIAVWLANHGRNLDSVRIVDIPLLVSKLRTQRDTSRLGYQASLRSWLEFRGFAIVRRPPKLPRYPWQQWLDDFDSFLASEKALARCTRRIYGCCARTFLRWQFRTGSARWDTVRPRAIWRYAEGYCGRMKPRAANSFLLVLRCFLRFVQLRGACGQELIDAVPRFSMHGHTVVRPGILSVEQERRLLAWRIDGHLELSPLVIEHLNALANMIDCYNSYATPAAQIGFRAEEWGDKMAPAFGVSRYG